jgi:hypothetical protein
MSMAETIAVAVAEPDGDVRPLGVIPNRPGSLRKLLKKLGPALTRARQGMVIFIPPGDGRDPTRLPKFYDVTFEYLRELGLASV